ncbi:RpiB/LacA/LacB family sugar-phosphate isomerase [Enterococcus sp.]|uniref:RpiB/LacA/LacB family sugar-phosphate isomerase n=1 Tax=Enterococcus sp. TaxID=35783 RepID=UPI000ECC10D9|nr:RpiB/LacA/LacB family sugar-phosphate isomerase [Enterococcus sp.]HAB96455.1 ribose-5-phosphate isomerase [Enterococcus sp.]
MKLVIGNDHAGYSLKETVIETAQKLGYEIVDLGIGAEEHVYTTPIAEKVSQYVVEQKAKGVLICGSGVGMAIAANKIRGVRCVNCTDVYTCQTSRKHNNTNILALGGRVIGKGLAEELVHTWLVTEYEAGRRETAYNLITELENKQRKS